MKRYLIIIFLGLAQILFAQEENELKVGIGGFGEFDHISYFKQVDGKVNSRNQAILQLELKADYGKRYRLFAATELRNDLSDKKRNRIYLDEAYFDIILKKIDLRFGKQIIHWGEADLFNPTNNINSVDFQDPLDTEDEEIGNYGLRFRYFPGDWKFETFFSPIFQANILPALDSRWFPPLADSLQSPFSPELLKANYSFGENTIGKTELTENFQAGLKIAGSKGGWDFSVSYYYGWNKIPRFEQTITNINNESIDIFLSPKFNRIHVLGGDFATILFAGIGLRGEGGFFLPMKSSSTSIEKDPRYVQYVLGLDRSFSQVIGDNSMNVMLQWLHEISLEEPFSTTDFNHIFQQTLGLRIEQDFSPYTKLAILAAYDFTSEGIYLIPEFSYQLHDGLTLNLLADILESKKKDTFIGINKPNSRAQVKLKYDF